MVSQGRLFLYIIFIAVMIFDTHSARAYFGYSSDLPAKNINKAAKTQRETALNQCAEDLCKEFDYKKSYKFFLDSNSKQAAESHFFDSNILPILQKKKNESHAYLKEAQEFLELAKSIEGEHNLSLKQRKAIAFIDLTTRINTPPLPVEQHMVFLGPTKMPFDMSHYFGKQFDESLFESMVKGGKYSEGQRNLVKNYIEKRDLSQFLPFLGQPDITSLIDTHGKGAQSLIDLAYAQIADYFSDPNRYELTDPEVFLRDDIVDSHRFLNRHFDIMTKMENIIPFNRPFLQQMGSLAVIKEVARISGKELSPDQLKVPTSLSKDQIAKAVHELQTRIKNTESYLNQSELEDKLRSRCQWKINLINESLPTDDELKKAEQIVTEAIVKFQIWLFDNFSSETATSTFDFLRSWQFFFPPSKAEFKQYITSLLHLSNKNWFFSTHPDSVSLILYHLSRESNPQGLSNYHGFGAIENFCKSLSINPLGDKANVFSGQVHLGWMALKDRDLLQTVVWHELGHIFSALLKGNQKWNFNKNLLGQIQDFEVSLESFSKYFSTRQCLGSNQIQKMAFKTLGEPHLSWFRSDQLADFERPNYRHDPNSVPSDDYKIGDMGEYVISYLEEQPSYLDTFSIKENSSSIETLSYVEGEFIEEDWADLVAASVSKASTNPLCYLIKGQDHLFWNEQKSLRNDQIPWIKKLKDTGIQMANPLTTDPKKLSTYRPYTKQELDVFNAHTPKHSKLFYRLIHTEILSTGVLPPSCQRAKKLDSDLKNINRCDYFN